MKRTILYFLILALAFPSLVLKTNEQSWTDTDYPNYITKVTNFGEQVDWLHGGRYILFLEPSFEETKSQYSQEKPYLTESYGE